MNKIEKIYPETLLQLICSVLKESPLFSYISGTQPFLMSYAGKEYYVYVKNLSSAYFKERPDTTRAQLPIKDEFDVIKSSSNPFIFLGYDQNNDVLVCWNYHVAKNRLNEKKSVSFYSRRFFQDEVISGELMRKKLKNGDEPILFKRKDLITFFEQIDGLFPENENVDSDSSHCYQESNPNNSEDTNQYISNGKVLKITDPDLLQQLDSLVAANHTPAAMKMAEDFYKTKYPNSCNAMKLKDWLALVKNINQDNCNQPILIRTDTAAEPTITYSNSNEAKFVKFMQDTNLSNKSINNYVMALYGRISVGVRTYIYPDLNDIFTISNAALLTIWLNKLFVITEFKELDHKGKNMYSCALKKYIQFLEQK